jgi:hypothetical protein
MHTLTLYMSESAAEPGGSYMASGWLHLLLLFDLSPESITALY